MMSGETEDAPLLVSNGGSCARRPPSPRRPRTATSPLLDEAALDLELGRLQSQLAASDDKRRPAKTQQQSRRTKERRSESGASSAVSAVRSVKTVEKISVAVVVVHLLKGNIGPGAMSLPNGFSKTGVYAGPALFVIVVRWAAAIRVQLRVSADVLVVFLSVGSRVRVQYGLVAAVQDVGEPEGSHVVWRCGAGDSGPQRESAY